MMNGWDSKLILRLIAGLWLPHQVFTQCATGCASCYSDGFRSICDRCDKGFWLNYPNCVPCPSNCETFTDDYTCQSCKPQFYSIGTQKTCQYACTLNCTELGCADETGYCNECYLGWYGSKCGEDCNLCRDGLCDLRKCSNGCKDGYVQDDVNPSNIYCRPCIKPDCMTCSNSTYCTQCNDIYYVRPYITPYGRGGAECLPCLSSRPCGHCDSILNCINCDRVNERLECSACETGYYLEKTQCVKHTQCPSSCNNCDTNGICNFDCKEGYAGFQCEYTCLNTCRACTYQKSCDLCKDGFYTDTCDTACNLNCLGDIPVCRMNDGYCLNGCTTGFWGERCQERCSEHCRPNAHLLPVCLRNGTCTHGCYIGYSGSDCSNEVSTTVTTTTTSSSLKSTEYIPDYSTTRNSYTTKRPTVLSSPKMNTNLELTDNKVPASAIGGGVGGGIAVIVAIVVIICYAKKRSLRKENARKQSTVYYNMPMSAVHDEESQAERNVATKDIEVASSSSQCEATLYEKLSDQNKGNLYDHLDHSS